jgi:cell division protein FtsB
MMTLLALDAVTEATDVTRLAAMIAIYAGGLGAISMLLVKLFKSVMSNTLADNTRLRKENEGLRDEVRAAEAETDQARDDLRLSYDRAGELARQVRDLQHRNGQNKRPGGQQ